MRKAIFTTSMIAFTAMALASCSDCEICTKDSAPEIRLCESDYDSNTEYGLALDYHTANGYDCR
jgi:hypothetical protein